jgi:histidine phosphotransferase ChpT
MAGDEKLSKGATKLLLNLGLIAVDALVRGGRLDIVVEKNGGVEIAIRAEGPRVALDDAIRDTLLKGGDAAVEARTAGAWLAHSLAAEAGGEIQLNRPSDEVLVIGATLPGHS